MNHTIYILHLYHPEGGCNRLLYHSRVKARKRAQEWLEQHFADKAAEYLHDIQAETDYFNPVFLAEIPDDIPATAHYIIRLGSTDVHYPATEQEAWRLIDNYALGQKFPSNYLNKLHTFLQQHGYEDGVKILFYPIEWGD